MLVETNLTVIVDRCHLLEIATEQLKDTEFQKFPELNKSILVQYSIVPSIVITLLVSLDNIY